MAVFGRPLVKTLYTLKRKKGVLWKLFFFGQKRVERVTTAVQHIVASEMDATVLQKYDQIKKDAVLKNIFDFDQFLKTVGMHELLMGFGANEGAARYDYRNVKYSVDSIKKHLGNSLDDNDSPPSNNGDMHLWEGLLFDLCFEKAFIPYLTNDFRQSFNNTNLSQTTDIRKQVESVVFAVDVRNLFDTASGQVKNAAIEALPPAPYFSFGESLYVQTAQFDVNKFKTMIIPRLAASFKPYFYYKYLYTQYTKCSPSDQKCVRIHMLACMVFIYYFAMSIFLIIFTTQEKTSAYKTATDQNDISINETRRTLVHIMDNTLVLLNDDAMRDNGEKTDIRDFYNNVKQMSLTNIKTSNNLVKIKNDIVNLQNNLNNFSSMEAIAAKNYFKIKVWFYVALIAWIGMTIYMVGLTLMRSFLMADILSGISIAVCIILAVLITRRR
jgi:hypothetical protein